MRPGRSGRWCATVALVGALAVGATPDVPVGVAVLLAGLGLLGLAWAPAAVVATVVAWSAGVGGALGPALLGVGIVLVAVGVVWRPPSVSTGIVALAVVEALRQRAAAAVLGPATGPVPELVLTLLVMAGAVECARRIDGPLVGPTPRSGGPERLLAAGAVVSALLAVRSGPPLAWSYPARVEGADLRGRLDLVRAAPDEDAAAIAPERREAAPADWRLALDAGWSPWRACPSDVPAPRLSWWPRPGAGSPCVDDGALAVEVAAEVDRRGRGGEALRLLGRHPRRGRVDWEMALYEAAQGAPSRWRGFVPAGVESLPGRFGWPVVFLGNAESAREVVAAWPVSTITIEGRGTPFEGPPTVAVYVDGRVVGRCPFDGPDVCTLPVGIAAGPHRVLLVFDSDRAGPGGDRNATVEAFTAR